MHTYYAIRWISNRWEFSQKFSDPLLILQITFNQWNIAQSNVNEIQYFIFSAMNIEWMNPNMHIRIPMIEAPWISSKNLHNF